MGINLGVLRKKLTSIPKILELLFGDTVGSSTFTDTGTGARTFFVADGTVVISDTQTKDGLNSGFFNSSSGVYNRIESTTTAPQVGLGFELSVWVYPTSLEFSSCEICGATIGGGNIGYGLAIRQSDSKITGVLFNTEVTSSNAITLNDWNKLTLKHTGIAGDVVRLIVNGVETIGGTVPSIGTVVSAFKVGLIRGGVASHFTGYVNQLYLK